MIKIKKFVLRMPVSLVSALDKIREQEGGYSRNRFILLILQDYVAEYLLPRGLSDRDLSFSEEELPLPACIICGCTDEHACEGGCHWVLPGLCSKCAEKLDEVGFSSVVKHPFGCHKDADGRAIIVDEDIGEVEIPPVRRGPVGRGRIVDENGKDVKIPPELQEVARRHAQWDGKSPHPYGCVGPDPDGECFDELDEQLGSKEKHDPSTLNSKHPNWRED